MTAVATELPVSPFKGLANYTEHDAWIFFGRDHCRRRTREPSRASTSRKWFGADCQRRDRPSQVPQPGAKRNDRGRRRRPAGYA